MCQSRSLFWKPCYLGNGDDMPLKQLRKWRHYSVNVVSLSKYSQLVQHWRNHVNNFCFLLQNSLKSLKIKKRGGGRLKYILTDGQKERYSSPFWTCIILKLKLGVTYIYKSVNFIITITWNSLLLKENHVATGPEVIKKESLQIRILSRT